MGNVTLWVRIEVPAEKMQDAEHEIYRLLDTDHLYAPSVRRTWEMDLIYGGQHR